MWLPKLLVPATHAPNILKKGASWSPFELEDAGILMANLFQCTLASAEPATLDPILNTVYSKEVIVLSEKAISDSDN